MGAQGNKDKYKDWNKRELLFIKKNLDKKASWFEGKLDRTPNAIYAQMRAMKLDPFYIEGMEFDENGAKVRRYGKSNFGKKVEPIKYESKIKELKVEVGKKYTFIRRLGTGMGKMKIESDEEITGVVQGIYKDFYTIDTGNYITTIPRWGIDYRLA